MILMFIAYADTHANVVAIRSNIIRSALLWVFTHLYRTTIGGDRRVADLISASSRVIF